MRPKMTVSAFMAATVAIVLCAGSPQSASADIITVTVTGIVASGIDIGGEFGSADADLSGAVYMSVQEFDTTLGVLDQNATELTGGTSDGSVSPSISNILTINGESISFTGSVFGQLEEENGGAVAVGQNSANALVTLILSPNNNIPDSITQSFSYAVPALLNSGSSLFYDNYDTLVLTPQTYTNADPIPEPSTWAVMICAISGLGVAARQRHIRRSEGMLLRCAVRATRSDQIVTPGKLPQSPLLV